MHVRRILASGLAACALFGIGAAVAPAAQAATPLTCNQVNQILARTDALITSKARSSVKHEGQGQHALAVREQKVVHYYLGRYNDMAKRYQQCRGGLEQRDVLFFSVQATYRVPARRS